MRTESIILILLVLSVILFILLSESGPYSVEKKEYYCYETNETCNTEAYEAMRRCENVDYTRDFPLYTLVYETRNYTETCHVSVYVKYSSVPAYEGLSMTCDIPMDIAGGFDSSSTRWLKYCSGSLKETLYETSFGWDP